MLEQRAGEIQSLKGLFRVQIKGPGIPFTQRVQGAVFFRRPQALRLQGFTPFGGELFEFVLAEDQFRLRIPSMGRSLEGKVGELNRSTDLARPFRLSVLAMTGVAGIAPVEKGAPIELFEDGSRYRLDVMRQDDGTGIARSGLARRIWFEREFLQVVREERFTESGDIDASIQCDDFRPMTSTAEDESVKEPAAAGPAATVDQVPVRPFKITAEDGQGQGSLVLTFQEMIPNPPLTRTELGEAFL
jgi:hypothetical protein